MPAIRSPAADSTPSDGASSADLLERLYNDLRHLAAQKLAQELPGQTLQPTALVHEAWLRLVKSGESVLWSGEAHFIGAASEAMRRILVERARRKSRVCHGGQWDRVEFDPDQIQSAASDPDDAVLAMDAALEQLAALSPEKAQIVRMRYFSGLAHEEIARLLGVSEPTVRRHWAFARAWLCTELRGRGHRPPTMQAPE